MGKQSFKGVPESNWVVGPCQTEEIAKQVLAVAYAYGWKWNDGDSYLNYSEWRYEKEKTCYGLIYGTYDKAEKYCEHSFISPETFLANNPMPEEKPEEKIRKPGVKYTLEDWKKEADTCRKRAEYWKKKFQKSENDHAGEIGQLESNIQFHTDELKNVQSTNKFLKESNVELRGANEALTKDARINRTEIALLKSDFETKNSELEIMEEDYNCLKDVQKYTKVVSWVGWIMFFICLFGFIFLKS